MRRRVGGNLASSSLLAPDLLASALLDIPGHIASAAEIARARTLFAHALDTPGGLRIQTIHAFCESVLHRFAPTSPSGPTRRLRVRPALRPIGRSCTTRLLRQVGCISSAQSVTNPVESTISFVDVQDARAILGRRGSIWR